MTSAARARLAVQFFTSMPPGAQLHLYAGIFFCFVPLGLLQTTFTVAPISWWEIAVVSLYSGLVAVVYAAVAMRKPRWIAVPIVAHIAFALLLGYLMPDRPEVRSLEGASLEALRTRNWIAGVLTVGSLAMAFVSFFSLIRREGLRFTAATTEVRLARDIHSSLVPPVSGATTSLQWQGRSQPSGDVGGDLVDVVTSSSGVTATVADVSGHGVAAGVLMGMFKTAFRVTTAKTADPASVLTHINHSLCALRQPHMFITAATMHVADDGLVQYVLAGHPSLLHLDARTGRATWVGESQLALTLIDDVAYTNGQMRLEPGDTLVAVTDGLLEVFDWRDRELGVDGLAAAVQRAGHHTSLDELEQAIFTACRAHGSRSDDQTVLLIRRR